MPRYRVHFRPITIDADSKIDGMAKALHFVDDNPSFIVAEEAGPEEKLSEPDDRFPILSCR